MHTITAFEPKSEQSGKIKHKEGERVKNMTKKRLELLMK